MRRGSFHRWRVHVASAFLFGCVLERFFARHASINTFTSTRVRSMSRGVIMNGRPRCGARTIL